MTVEVKTVNAESMDREVSLQGQLEPVQHLFLRAQTSGTVTQILVNKGSRVDQGTALVQLDQGGRKNALAEAQARVKTARSEQKAARSLRKQRLQSQLQLEQAEASLEAALAQLANVELDLDYTTLLAPFNSIVNDLPIDHGALIERGDVVAELLDDSAFDVSAQASQQVLSSLRIGQTVSVELITGEVLAGTLTYISSIADAQTRSFRIEARVNNQQGSTAAGVSATLNIPVEKIEAVFITPSAISLGDDGELGVKAIDENNTVIFLPISLVSTSLDGAWVSGIPDGSRLITLGQGFVSTGETVTPHQPAEATQEPAQTPTRKTN